jgi:hypothetical protein
VGKAKRAHPSLSERSGDILQITAPIGRKQPTFDEAMKTAVPPIHNARDFAVLHWIEVNVIDVAFEVGVVANGVLPKKRRCQRPFSRFRILLGDLGRSSMPREKPLLMRFHRVEKSGSSSGNFHKVWM